MQEGSHPQRMENELLLKTFIFRFTLLFLSILLSGCSVSLRSMIATPASTTLPTPTWDFYELLNQAATQAPFTLLVPDEAKLPFAIEHTGLDFIPGLKTQPFVVTQSYLVRGSLVRITQTSQPGQIPAKAVEETTVRGVVGYWVVLNTGKQVLYWGENNTSLTIGGDPSAGSGEAPADEDILILAESLVPYKAGIQVTRGSQPTNLDVSRLIESLTHQGFDLELIDTNPPTAMLAPAPGVAYRLGAGWLHIHCMLNQPVKRGATLTGQVIAGYGDHRPISDLPLRVRQKGDGS
jgi:hypothetical protein